MTDPVGDGELMMCNTLHIDTARRDEYLRELAAVLPPARALPGCLLLAVGERPDAAGTFVLTERWRNGREYVEEYLRLTFYRRYLAATEPMYRAPREVVLLVAVGTSA